MMEFWLYLHILLLVFWVGTDLGVFLAARYSERSNLSIQTRQTVLELGMKLDRLPRTALVLIIPSGIMLAHSSGMEIVAKTQVAGVWIAAVVWLGILWLGFLSSNPQVRARSAALNWWFNLLAALITLFWAWWLYAGSDLPAWIIFKVMIVGCVFVAGFLLDFLFGPAMGVFSQIEESSDNEDLNKRYSKALAPVYWVVLLIYVLTLGAAAAGIFKFG